MAKVEALTESCDAFSLLAKGCEDILVTLAEEFHSEVVIVAAVREGAMEARGGEIAAGVLILEELWA